MARISCTRPSHSAGEGFSPVRASAASRGPRLALPRLGAAFARPAIAAAGGLAVGLLVFGAPLPALVSAVIGCGSRLHRRSRRGRAGGGSRERGVAGRARGDPRAHWCRRPSHPASVVRGREACATRRTARVCFGPTRVADLHRLRSRVVDAEGGARRGEHRHRVRNLARRTPDRRHRRGTSARGADRRPPPRAPAAPGRALPVRPALDSPVGSSSSCPVGMALVGLSLGTGRDAYRSPGARRRRSSSHSRSSRAAGGGRDASCRSLAAIGCSRREPADRPVRSCRVGGYRPGAQPSTRWAQRAPLSRRLATFHGGRPSDDAPTPSRRIAEWAGAVGARVTRLLGVDDDLAIRLERVHSDADPSACACNKWGGRSPASRQESSSRR